VSPAEREARLAEEVRVEMARLEKVVRELAEVAATLGPGCPPSVSMAVAGYLHSFYTGCESVLARIARAAGDMPRGEGWRQELLFRAAAPLDGVRPPVLTPQTASKLQSFLRFRHFFRVSYGVDLDVGKLREHVDAAPEAHRLFANDVASFLARLG
jgi:hypothetical protein